MLREGAIEYEIVLNPVHLSVPRPLRSKPYIQLFIDFAPAMIKCNIFSTVDESRTIFPDEVRAADGASSDHVRTKEQLRRFLLPSFGQSERYHLDCNDCRLFGFYGPIFYNEQACEVRRFRLHSQCTCRHFIR